LDNATDPARLRVLGGLHLDLPDEGAAGRAAQKKRLALLAYLAAIHPDGAGREILATLLWPENDPGRGRRRLSATLYELRRVLGPVVVEVAETLRYDPTVLPCDAIDFVGALDRGDMEAAVALYGGPFLEGVHLKGADEFERWATGRRDEYGRQFAEALESWAEAGGDAGDALGAASAWQRLATHDPYNARVAVRTMRALAEAGDRAGAIAHGARHVAMLQTDLEVEPNPEVTGLVEELRGVPTSGSPGLATARDWPAPIVSAESAARPMTRTQPPASQRSGRSWTGFNTLTLVAGIALASVLTAGWLLGTGRPGTAGGDSVPLLLILPFEHRGAEEDAHFTEGVTEELSARLTAAPGLRVIGRATALHYRGLPVDLRRIRDDLGVDYALQGTVRWERGRGGGDRVRITPELIRTSDGVPVWAAVYERQVDQLFAVQTLIARDLVEHLGLTLMGHDGIDLDRPPTDHLGAHTYYLQGISHGARRVSEAPARAAVVLFERAVELDPDFAEAWWRLVHARVWLGWLLADREEGLRARLDLQRLLEFGEDRVEVRLGRGWFLYYGERRYDEALRDFEWVARKRPGDAEVLKTVGYLQRRLGLWDDAVATMRAALELNPRDHALVYTLAQSLHWMGRHGEAREYYEQAVLLAPDIGTYHGALADLHVARGDTLEAWHTLARSRDFGVDPWYRPRVHLYRRAFQAAADSLHRAEASQPLMRLYRYDALADAADRLGEQSKRQLYADSLLRYSSALAGDQGAGGGLEIRNTANVFRGLALVHAGDSTGAAGLARQGLEAEAAIPDAVANVQAREAAARLFTRLGRYEDALDLLDSIRSAPSPLSSTDLRLDPEWDPLRLHGRFQRLLIAEP